MAQLPAATHRPPSLPSNQECAQCVNREPELAIVTSRGYDPRQSPGPGYKRVVSCKGSSHGTDVLAVSEHGAPGRRPNIHAHFVGRRPMEFHSLAPSPPTPAVNIDGRFA